MRILVIEDEKSIAAEIAATLTNARYVVDVAHDGENGWFRAETEDYQAIVLDLGLPRLDGLSVVKKLRGSGIATPILILTARGSWMERVEGIDAGADDYLPKPFHDEELLARLDAIIRRSTGHASPVLESGPLRVDTRRAAVTLSGKSISLTSLEYRALRYLLQNKGRPVSQSELGEHVYGGELEPDSNALEVLIRRISQENRAGLRRHQARLRLHRSILTRMLSFLPEGFRPKSFRARLTSAAAVTSLAVLAVVWLLLGRMFEDHIERLIEDDLQSRMLEIAGLLEVDDAGHPNLVAEPADPRYQRPAGGAYWRIEEGGKTILRSFSLWDFDFTPSNRAHLSPTGVASEQHGPNGSTVYLAKRDVTLDGVRGPHDLRVEVALDTSHVQRLRTSFERQSVIALGVIGLALSLGIWIQSSFALRPLNAIREQLNRIHGGLDLRMKGQFPQEIAPLVDDLNKLLARQEDLVRRARERAGDLAHGLKTPLTLLQIEASNAQQRGDAKTAASLREQVAIMNRHIDRELRRARMSGAAAGGGAFVDARETVEETHSHRSAYARRGNPRLAGPDCRWRAIAHGPRRLRRNCRQHPRQRP